MLHRRKFCTTFFALLLTVCMAGQAGAIHTSAASAVLIEQKSGRVLYEQSADDERLIASITKIMTALVPWSTPAAKDYTVTERILARAPPCTSIRGEPAAGGAAVWPDAGQRQRRGPGGGPLRVRGTGGFRGADERNRRELGMTHSHFANPNGLDAQGHYSSARDMAVLTAHALK